MHVIGQINNNLIIINLNSMGLLSLLDNGLSYKNFKQQSQHIIQMYVKKQEVLVHSWIKESPLLFCFVCFVFFCTFLCKHDTKSDKRSGQETERFV